MKGKIQVAEKKKLVSEITSMDVDFAQWYTDIVKKAEMALWKIIPPEEGSDFCHRLVYHGREVCTARTKPYCDRCCLEDICAKNI